MGIHIRMILVVAFIFNGTSLLAADRYMKPPEELARLVDAPLTPIVDRWLETYVKGAGSE